jgi:hypothetical protein
VPADKDAAKRRRQARNRQERENRQARTEGAKRAAARPSRTATDVPTKGGAKTSLDKTPARSAPAPGGFMSKLFPPRPEADSDGGPDRGAGTATRPARQPRPPSEVIEVEGVSGPRGRLLTWSAQPGGRAVVMAMLALLAGAAALLAGAPVAPPPVLDQLGAVIVVQQDGGDPTSTAALDDVKEDFREDPVAAPYSEGLIDLVGPVPAVFYILVPLLIGALALRALTRPTRSRSLMISSIAGVAFVILTGPVGIFSFLGVLALGFAAYQSAKADRAALAASS